MKQYEVVAEADLTVLERQVSARLKLGWTLQGGLAIYQGTHAVYFYQAMIRETPDTED